MQIQSRAVLILSVVLFIFGLLLGLLFSAGTVWGDLEAALFDTSMSADAALSSLRCPVLITPREAGQVSASFANSSKMALLRTVRAHISYGFATLMREEQEQFTLQPGETRRVTWTVSAEDAAWRHFILVRIHELRNSPLPSRTGACGVLVLNVPGLTGGQLVALIVATSLLSMAAGIVLWISGRRASTRPIPDLTRSMAILAGLTLLTMAAGARGSWLLGILLILLTLLLGVIMVTWAVSHAG